jgi:hypothetical protein
VTAVKGVRGDPKSQARVLREQMRVRGPSGRLVYGPRGRWDIVVVFDDGTSMRFLSDVESYLSPAETVVQLRAYADQIEQAMLERS